MYILPKRSKCFKIEGSIKKTMQQNYVAVFMECTTIWRVILALLMKRLAQMGCSVSKSSQYSFYSKPAVDYGEE